MVQTGLFWQNGSWARGVWFDQAYIDNGRNWLRPQYIWLNGDLISIDAAPEHFLPADYHDWLEGVRGYSTRRGPAIFRLNDYLERFLHTLKQMTLEPGQTIPKLRQAVCQTVQANGLVESYIRPVVFYDAQHRESGNGRPVIGIVAWRWPTWGPEMDEEKRHRHELAVTTHYGSHQGGAGVTLLSTTPTTEYTTETILVVRQGILYTAVNPPTLGSLMRDTVLTLGQGAGYDLRYTDLNREMLRHADEVMVCTMADEVRGVWQIDGEKVGNGRTGPITRQLRQLVSDTARGLTQPPHGWLDYMDPDPII